MEKCMLSDLNTILYNTINCKQELEYYKLAAAKNAASPSVTQNFVANSFMRLSFTDLHKLVSFSHHDFFSLWNFWDRIENGHYDEAAIPDEVLNGWRQTLFAWKDQIDTLERLRMKYAGRLVDYVAPEAYTITLKETEALLKIIEKLVLAMLNPVLETNFTELSSPAMV